MRIRLPVAVFIMSMNGFPFRVRICACRTREEGAVSSECAAERACTRAGGVECVLERSVFKWLEVHSDPF